MLYSLHKFLLWNIEIYIHTVYKICIYKRMGYLIAWNGWIPTGKHNFHLSRTVWCSIKRARYYSWKRMAEGEGEVKRPRLSDSAQCNKVALITGITGQVWRNQLFIKCDSRAFMLSKLYVGWVIFGWTSFRKRIYSKYNERIYTTWILLHGTRYTVSSVDLVPLTQDVSYTYMLTAQLTLLEVRTLIQLHCTQHVLVLYQEWYCTMAILLMPLHWSDW